MVDYFTIALSHGLLALALYRLVMREDLDVDPADIAVSATGPVTDSDLNKGQHPHA